MEKEKRSAGGGKRQRERDICQIEREGDQRGREIIKKGRIFLKRKCREKSNKVQEGSKRSESVMRKKSKLKSEAGGDVEEEERLKEKLKVQEQELTGNKKRNEASRRRKSGAKITGRPID